MISLSELQFYIAVKRFNKKRGDWYDYMAALLKGSSGRTKILDIFQNDAVRYAGQPRGILSAHWVHAYLSNGADLADALEGTLPADEVAIIRVAQDSGANALVIALSDLTRVVRLTEEVKQAVLMIGAYGFAALLIALFSMTLSPMILWSQLLEAFSMLPREAWGPNAKLFDSYLQFYKDYWFYMTVVAASCLAVLIWSIDGLVGDFRIWLDKKVAFYQIARDLKAALFLSTMATLTRQRSGIGFTLRKSLEIFKGSVRSKWFGWRISEIIDRIDESPEVASEVFDTGILSTEMYFFLEDMQKAKGFAEGFEETATYVETSMIKKVISRMNFYKWIMVIVSLLVALGMYAWSGSVQNEMRGSMKTYLSSG